MRHPLALGFAALAFAAAPVAAEELAVVGSWSGLPLHKQFEAPYWTEKLPAAAEGVTVQLTTHDQMGLGVGDIFRLLGDGVYDVAMTVADYAVADAPELEGLDVPLVATDAGEARAMVDAAWGGAEDADVVLVLVDAPRLAATDGGGKSRDDPRGILAGF
ncbi:MAG: C4-dicarboxylate ABC transporter substrate-binding protein, partial [Pseudomonadota bacterium]